MVAYLSQGPPLYEPPLADTRKAIDDAQAGGSVPMPDVEETWVKVPADVGDVRALIIKPRGATAQLPAVLYMHGGGWIFGSVRSHGRLAGELAVAADAAVVFIDYALAPEAKYPVQIEQCYAVARWVTEQGETHGLDPSRIAVAGDSAGGNMATVLCVIAKQRGDVSFVQQSMCYPMTDALTSEDSESYRLFKDGPYGDAKTMEWFWNSYLPEQDVLLESTVSPLRATLDELTGLPPALIALASERHHAWLRERGAVPVAYGDGVSERIAAAAKEAPVAAFVDLVGDGYVELALELGIAKDRIDTIVDFPATDKYGVKFEGGAAAASAATLAELAGAIAAGELVVPIQPPTRSTTSERRSPSSKPVTSRGRSSSSPDW